MPKSFNQCKIEFKVHFLMRSVAYQVVIKGNVNSGVIHDLCHAIKAREEGIYIINIRPASERVFTDVSYCEMLLPTLCSWRNGRHTEMSWIIEELFHGTSLTCCIATLW